MSNKINLFSMTLEELHFLQEASLNNLIKHAGSPQHLATMLDKPLSTVCGWIERGRISKEGAKLVEQHPKLGKQFKLTTLRPELSK